VNLIVLIHMCGHFAASRIFGVGIEVVSIGLGPKAISFSWNEIVWKVCWLPIGGFVRPHSAGNDGGIFTKQIGVALSGPILNIASAFGLFFVLFATIGAPAIQSEQEALVQLSVGDGLLLASRSIVWTWTNWSTDQSRSLAILYDSPVSRLTCLAAIWSSKLGILNLLPIPKFDGWSILRLSLASITSLGQADRIMKWVLRLILVLFVLVIAGLTWNDLVQLRVIETVVGGLR
jgi:membrane-associated protease RseP (regulator of RpoE activity)